MQVTLKIEILMRNIINLSPRPGVNILSHAPEQRQFSDGTYFATMYVQYQYVITRVLFPNASHSMPEWIAQCKTKVTLIHLPQSYAKSSQQKATWMWYTTYY